MPVPPFPAPLPAQPLPKALAPWDVFPCAVPEPFLLPCPCTVAPRLPPLLPPLTCAFPSSCPTWLQIWGSASSAGCPLQPSAPAHGGAALQEAPANHRDKDKPLQLWPAGQRQRALGANTLPRCTAAAPLQHPRGRSNPRKRAGCTPRSGGCCPSSKSCPSPHRPATSRFQLPAAFIFAPNEHKMQQQSRFLLGQVPVPVWRERPPRPQTPR